MTNCSRRLQTWFLLFRQKRFTKILLAKWFPLFGQAIIYESFVYFVILEGSSSRCYLYLLHFYLTQVRLLPCLVSESVSQCSMWILICWICQSCSLDFSNQHLQSPIYCNNQEWDDIAWNSWQKESQGWRSTAVHGFCQFKLWLHSKTFHFLTRSPSIPSTPSTNSIKSQFC